jgi:hypothetical protein
MNRRYRLERAAFDSRSPRPTAAIVQRLGLMILIGLSSQASLCLSMTQGDVHNGGQMTVRRS